MYKQKFGRRNQMKFSSPQEYYETLGFLAKSDGSIQIYWENNQNQGAWGSEGRIHCMFNLIKFTAPLRAKFTAGRGRNVLHRINCNEFVQDLVCIHSFSFGANQNTAIIRSTIPAQYVADFNRGLAL